MVSKATECRFAKRQREEDERERERKRMCVCVGERRSKHTHMHRFCFTGQFFSCRKKKKKKSPLSQTTLVVRVNSASTRAGRGRGGIWVESRRGGSGLQILPPSGVRPHRVEVSHPRHQHRDLKSSRQMASALMAP